MTLSTLVILVAVAASPPPSPNKGAEAPARLVATESGVSAQIKVVIDVPSRRAEYAYRFESEKTEPLDLEVGVGTPDAKAARLALSPRAGNEFREVEELPETMFGKTGGHVRLHPRVRVRARQDDSRAALLAANYTFDFEVRLPPGARLLSSMIPFRLESPNQFRWKGSGLTVVPPIDILYTLAQETVSLSKQMTEDQRIVTVKVSAKNDGAQRIGRVDLRAQFPRGAYEVEDLESSGRFQIVDDQIVRWAAQVTALDPGQASELTLVLVKPSATTKAWDFDVFAYNAAGELIATAPTAR